MYKLSIINELILLSGLLVDVNVERSPTVSPTPPEPSVAKIISIDNSWDAEEDREDAALVGTSQIKSDEDILSSPSRQKPARPAPPKPSVRRAKTVKEKPDLPPRPSERAELGSSSPPAGQANEAQSLIIIDSRQKSKSVRYERTVIMSWNSPLIFLRCVESVVVDAHLALHGRSIMF